MLKAKGKIVIASLLALIICAGSFSMAEAAQESQSTNKYMTVNGEELRSPVNFIDGRNTLTFEGYEVTAINSEMIHYYSEIPFISGYDDGTIRPDASVTRAEAAQMLYLVNNSLSGSADFSDVSDGAWYYEAVTSLAGSGIISGYSDGSFKPDNNITCAEFVALVVKFAEPTVQTYSTLNHWAGNYLATAEDAGYLRGLSDFQPDRNITRAEAVSIINRAIGRSTGNPPAQSPYTDIDSSHWAYADIIAASAVTEVDYSALNLDTTIVIDENGTVLEEYTLAENDYSGLLFSGYTYEGSNVITTYTIALINGDSGKANNDPTKTITGPTYTITYDANGSPGTVFGDLPVDDNVYSRYDNVKVLFSPTLSRQGYAFDGWNTEADGSGTGYAPEAIFAITGDVILYAQWRVSE